MVIFSTVHRQWSSLQQYTDNGHLFSSTQTRSTVQQYTDTVKCSTVHMFNSTQTRLNVQQTQALSSVQQYTDNGHLFNSTQTKVICLTVHRQWSSVQQYTDNGHLFNSTQTIVICSTVHRQLSPVKQYSQNKYLSIKVRKLYCSYSNLMIQALHNNLEISS